MRVNLDIFQKNQKGFALPTIILLTLVMSFVAYAALLQSNNNLNLSYKQAYIQIARVASKSAIDYSQEQFDNAPCGNYNGTPEQTLMDNNRYRVTMKAEVIETSADGYEKTIKGTGSVYLPRASEDAKYVFDIRSEIVRTYALCKTPDNFNPVLWLDASDTSTLFKGLGNTTTVTSATDFGSASANTRDTVEERVDNGSQTDDSWPSNDLEMHRCDSTEFSSSVCNNNSQRYLYSGIVFQNVNVPKNATITSAALQLNGGTPSGQSGPVIHRIYGLYKTSTNPHLDLFNQGDSNQVRTPITTSSLHTTAYKDVATNNFPPGNAISLDVTNVVQEMVNSTGWNPGGLGNGGRLGFGIHRQSGNGTRRALKDNIKLVVTFSTVGISPADNNDPLAEWHDKSGNGNHAISTHGNAPTRIDNQINSKTIVRFGGGNMLSSLTSPLNSKREMTVLGVLKSNFSSSSSDARIISGMHSSYSNDTAGTNSIIPLLRNTNTSGFSNIYAGSSSANRTDYACNTVCDNQPFVITSSFQSENATSTKATLKGNGSLGATKSGITPSASPPYTYSINQLYIAGKRDGSMPGVGQNYMYGDFAELVVYDKALTCREVEAIEEYLRAKWNVYASPPQTSCPADTIPTL